MSDKTKIQRDFLIEIGKNDQAFVEYLIKHFPLFKTLLRISTPDNISTVTQHWILTHVVDTTKTMQYDKFTQIELNFIRALYLKYKEDNNIQ